MQTISTPMASHQPGTHLMRQPVYVQRNLVNRNMMGSNSVAHLLPAMVQKPPTEANKVHATLSQRSNDNSFFEKIQTVIDNAITKVFDKLEGFVSSFIQRMVGCFGGANNQVSPSAVAQGVAGVPGVGDAEGGIGYGMPSLGAGTEVSQAGPMYPSFPIGFGVSPSYNVGPQTFSPVPGVYISVNQNNIPQEGVLSGGQTPVSSENDSGILGTLGNIFSYIKPIWDGIKGATGWFKDIAGSGFSGLASAASSVVSSVGGWLGGLF